MALATMAALVAVLATGQPVGPHRVGCDVNEMSGVHVHARLSISNRGADVAVPANIGIVTIAGGAPLCLYWLHTHDESGTIHVEAPSGSYTLADFFAVWGQPLSRTQVGSIRGHVIAYVNGAPYKGAPQSIPLRDGEQIELVIR
jgi:hypothetical protein